MKTCVVINDFTTCEEIALGVQMPILRDMGHQVLAIPSKILSYPLCVEGAAALESTDFAKEMLEFFSSREDKIDAVLTGFLPNAELITETKAFCEEQKKKGAIVFVDPVFADNGKPYNSVKSEHIEALKALLSVADYCFPNYTEGCILTNSPYKDRTDINGMTQSEAKELLLKLQSLGVKTPVVTGCVVNKEDVIIYLNSENELCLISYTRVEGSFSGTGDRFAAGVAGRMLSGDSLQEAILKTADEITKKILQK